MRARDLLVQAIFLALLAGAVAVMAATARGNLASQHIGNGFGFLLGETGWDVASSLIAHSSSDPYWRTFLAGLLNTLLLAAIGVVLAGLAGAALGFAAASPNPLLAGACLVYVTVVRNIPQIVQVFFWYSVTRQLPPVRQAISVFDVAFISNRGLNLPSLTIDGGAAWAAVAAGIAALAFWPVARRQLARLLGCGERRAVAVAGAALVALAMLATVMLDGPAPRLGLDVPRLSGFNFRGGILLGPEFVALITAIVLYNTAFIAEIIRGGIASVPAGQVEAARSLGLRRGLIFRKIVLPQAIRVIIPPLTSQAISLTKSTSLAVAIGYTELFQVATIAINNTGQSLENIALLMVVYMSLSLGLSALGRGLARAFSWPQAR